MSLVKRVKKPNIEKVCEVCKKIYYVYPYRIQSSKVCSYKCLGVLKKNSIERKCLNCGKLFNIRPSQFTYYKGAGKYCSRECSYIGIVKETEQKPSRDKYGRTRRKLDLDWQKKVRERDSWKCAKCGKYDKYIHTHHVKPRSRFPELKHDVSNGICLCNSCHTWAHNHPKEASISGFLYSIKYL